MRGIILSFASLAIMVPQSSDAATKHSSSKAASAPRKRAPSGRPPTPKVDPIERLSEELVLNSIGSDDENLASACSLSNFKGLLWALDGVVGHWNFDKGEFETSADYAARMAKMEDTVGGTRQTIVCKALRNETSFVKYDADQQEFSVDTFSLTNIASDEKDTGSYISSTRMGVKAKVYRSLRVDYEVGLKGKYDLAHQLGCATRQFYSIRFSVPANDAVSLRAAGYLVMLGHLKQPFSSKTEKSGEPTLDDPFDVYTVTLELKFEPRTILLVSPSGQRFSCLGA